jgi:hypothetical protein
MFSKLQAVTLMYVPGDTYKANLSAVKKLQRLVPAKPITDLQTVLLLNPLTIIDKERTILTSITIHGRQAMVWNRAIQTERDLNERMIALIDKYAKLRAAPEYHWQVDSYPDGVNFWENVKKAKEGFESGTLLQLWKNSQYFLVRSKVYEGKILEEVPEVDAGRPIPLIMEVGLTYWRQWLEGSFLQTDSKTVNVQLGVLAPSRDGIPQGVDLKDNHINWISILNPEAISGIPQ